MCIYLMIEDIIAFLQKSLLWKEYVKNGCLEKFPILHDFDVESN